jgi:predicted enzyme related to lactoylglutathione lyase
MNQLLHVNINAKDWKKLASFYEKVFGCVQIPPEKHLSGEFAEELTGLKNVVIEGMTMEFPGNRDGVQLEIFQYNQPDASGSGAINMTGFGHIAIQIEDIEETTKKLLAAGGSYVGNQVSRPNLLIHYVKDCEGNIIELMCRKSE